jgi:hypothetical protein
MATFEFVGAQASNGGGMRYTFKGADANAVAAAVGDYFARRGYSLEEGTPVNGSYGKGSAAMRALFGGFVTRFKFKVAVTPGQGVTELDLSKAMSGAMGGAIGASKMTKEYAAIQAELQAL